MQLLLQYFGVMLPLTLGKDHVAAISYSTDMLPPMPIISNLLA